MVGLPLVWRATSVPEKQPLQAFAALMLVLEPKCVVLVGYFKKVEQLGGGLHDGEWRGLSIINNDRNPAFTSSSVFFNIVLLAETEPFGFKRRNQSFFCSLVAMFINEYDHCVLYTSLSSSRRIWTFCPLGVF